MAVAGGASKAVAFGIGIGVASVIALAWRFSEKRVHQSEMEREAQTELVRFASSVARCAAGDQVLPETSERVPLRLAEVAGKAYVTQDGDYRGRAFACAKFAARSPQRLQYRWLKEGSLYGRAEARGDADGDGVPDTWYEIRVDCSNAGCEAPNYPHEVLTDGRRVPPGLLGMLGRARATEGEAPSLLADDGPRAGVATGREVPRPAPVIEPGAPLALDTLFIETERRATVRLPGAQLLELEVQGARGAVIDPKQGAAVRARYGVTDAAGWVAKGAPVLRVTFDPRGLSEEVESASRPLYRAGFPACLPGKLVAGLPGAEPRSLTLSFDVERQRAVWRVKEESAPQRSYGADSCALVR